MTNNRLSDKQISLSKPNDSKADAIRRNWKTPKIIEADYISTEGPMGGNEDGLTGDLS